MFGFFKKHREIQEAQKKIGSDLHRQIKEALKSNDALATERLHSSFTVGYITGFIRSGFMVFSIEPDKIIDDEICYICDGIIKNVLYKIYTTQAAALKLTLEMKDQHSKILDTGLSPVDVSESFKLGMKAGNYDAPLISLKAVRADNFRRYLLKEPLQLQ